MPVAEYDPTSSVEATLRGVLARHALEVSDAELAELASLFIEAGSHAVLAQIGSAADAAQAAAFVHRLGSRARRRTAADTRPSDASAAFTGGEWAPVLDALERHRGALERLPGVVGFGPGYRRRGSTRGNERCVVIFVRKKRDRQELEARDEVSIPASLTTSSGEAVATDIVQLSRLTRQLQAGRGIGPVDSTETGTLGAYARDLASGAAVAITAMHVSGVSTPPAGGLDFLLRDQGGDRPLGELLRGSMSGIDAASIALLPTHRPDNELPGIGPLRGWRPVNVSADYQRSVRVRGALTGQVRHGVIVEPMIHLPQYDLESCILVDIQTKGGDSGAALVDDENLVLGFLVGRAETLGGVKVFTPASLVMQALSSDFPWTEEQP